MKTEIQNRLLELKGGLKRYLAQANKDKKHDKCLGEIKTLEDLEIYEVIVSRVNYSLNQARKLDAAIFELEQIQKLNP